MPDSTLLSAESAESTEALSEKSGETIWTEPTTTAKVRRPIRITKLGKPPSVVIDYDDGTREVIDFSA